MQRLELKRDLPPNFPAHTNDALGWFERVDFGASI